MEIKIQYAERSFLGCLMNDNTLINDTLVKPKHMTVQTHKKIYETMLKLNKKGFAIDAVTILTKIDIQSLESVGGSNYLTDLQSAGNESKFEHYEKLILTEYQKFKTRDILTQAQEKVDTCEDINDFKEEIISQLNSLDAIHENDKSTIYQLAADMYELAYKEELSEKGIPTGLSHFDTVTGGLRRGELIIVAARPSIGKTAFSLNIAINAAQNETNVMFFSLEMPKKSIAYRLAAHIGNINLNKFKNPTKFFSQEEKDRWTTIVGELSQLNISIFDKPAQTIAEIRSKIRKEIRENPNKNHVVLIDYLQLIKPNNENTTTNVQISQISRDLKNIAREFNIPVVCLSQLNRAVEQRQDKHPIMSDLRDSGSIEQDADIIALLYRDGYYNKEKMENPNVDTLEINIAKNRNGQTGYSKAYYNLSRGVIRQ